MRVLHVVHTPRYSGAEMLVLALTRLHNSMGHTSAVVAIWPTAEDFKIEIAAQAQLNINWMVPRRALMRVSRIFHLRKASERFNPDVIFAHSVLPAAYARIAGLRRVISVLHDANEDEYRSGRISLAERGLQYRSAGVISVSPTALINYSNRYSVPLLACIPNGIALDTYRNIRLERRAEFLDLLGLPQDAVIALQVGRITSIKQQHLSVRAIARLVKTNPKIHLLLAGIHEDSVALLQLKTEIQTQNLEDNVHLMGPRDDVPLLLQLANVYLMPSKQEAHSLALIEALASGVAVVASNIPAFHFTKDMAGVALINPDIINCFASAIEVMLEKHHKYSRDLENLDILDVAKKYIEFAKLCIATNQK